MNSAFNSQILAEKLRKLNNSQQSIETLSHWCIFHRKKARLVVETWDKQVRDVSKDQQTPLLYLANDILQNSRRRGGEFVTEFWKILPGTLKDVMEKGDERVHTVVFRLVDIWDERKVFGSRSRTLREELLGDDPPADLPEQCAKPSNTIRIKVPMGGIQEKLTSAYRSVSDVVSDEDATLGRCKAAVIRVEGLEKEATTSKAAWESQDFTSLAEELQEQQNILNHGVEQLEICELARAALVSHLKEALREQESKLELIRTQMQTARARADRSGKVRAQLLVKNGASVPEVDKGPKEQGSDADGVGGPLSWPAAPFVENLSSVPDETITTKAPKTAPSVAAEVAAKLAASASSAQMLKSVLSSLVAGEASNSHPESAPSTEIPPTNSNISFNPEKRQRLNGPNEYGQGNQDSPNSYPQHSAPMLPRQSNMNMGMMPPQPPADPSLHMPMPQQTSLSNAQQAQIPTQPPPLIQQQPQQQYAGQGSNIHVPGFGYAPVAPNPPLPPPMMQRQFVGMPPMMPMLPQQQNQQSGQPFQSVQPPPPGYYGQPLLPAHVPRQ